MDSLPVATHLCSKCKTPFPFKGREYRCNTCLAARARERRAKNGERVREIERQAKRRAREAEPDKHAEANNAWRAANPEKLKEHKRTYHTKNAGRIYGSVKAWRAANPNKVSEQRQRHYTRHKPDYHQKVVRRRAKLSADSNSYSEAEFQAKLRQYGGRCHWCGEQIVGSVHRDHVVALSLKGSNSIANVVPSCSRCNLSKGAKTPLEFAGRLF